MTVYLTAATESAWLIISGVVLLVITVASGVGELYRAHARKKANR